MGSDSPGELASWFRGAVEHGTGLPNPEATAASVLYDSWPHGDEAAEDVIVEGLLAVLTGGPDDARREAMRALQPANTARYRAMATEILAAAPGWLDHRSPVTGTTLGYDWTMSLLNGPGATDAGVARALWSHRDRWGTGHRMLESLLVTPVLQSVGVEVVRAEHAAGRLDVARLVSCGGTIALYGRADAAIEIGALLRTRPEPERREFLRAATIWIGDRAAELARALDLSPPGGQA